MELIKRQTDLSMSGPWPSAGGSLVCGGWGGRPAGRDRRTGHGWTASNGECLILLHALQYHSKSELEYRNREKSFHARDLNHRYNANNSNWRLSGGSPPPRQVPGGSGEGRRWWWGGGGRKTRRFLLGGKTGYGGWAPSGRLSFYASSSSSTLSSAGSAGDSWCNLWRQNCSRWTEPTGGRDACSPQASGQKKRHCDIWSSVWGKEKEEGIYLMVPFLKNYRK